MTQSPIKRREYENVFSRGAVFSPGQSDDVSQNLAVAPRRDRQAMLEIPGRKTAVVGIITKFDLALFQRFAVGRTDDRQQHAGPLAVRQDVPVDVERYRVWRGRAPFQYVEPPWIVGEMHADMVGDEIEKETKVVLRKRPAQPLAAGVAAEFRIELAVIDDVVAMGRAFARLHEGRCIEMRDAERLQVRDDFGGLLEIEIGSQLQAIGRDRNGRRHFLSSDMPEHRPGRELFAGLAAPNRRAGRLN